MSISSRCMRNFRILKLGFICLCASNQIFGCCGRYGVHLQNVCCGCAHSCALQSDDLLHHSIAMSHIECIAMHNQ